MIFSEGNQRVYLYAKHKAMTFLDEITPKTNVLIAYHGAAAGEVAAICLIKFLLHKKNKNYLLFNFAELRAREFEQLKKIIQSKKIDKLIILEGFNLPDYYSEFSSFALNIDSHFNDKEPIENFLNPVVAKFDPLPSVSLMMYDLLKKYVPDKYRWLVAISSILDYNSEAAKLIIQEEKEKVRKLPDIRYTFWSCQYNEKFGNKLIEKLLEKPQISVLEKDPELIKRRDEFLKRIENHIAEIKKKYKKGPVYYEVMSDNFRLTSPLASFLQDHYPDKLIFIVERFKDADIVRISVRYKNEEVNLGKICQKLAKQFADTDAIGYKETASFRTKKKIVKPLFELLSKYC